MKQLYLAPLLFTIGCSAIFSFDDECTSNESCKTLSAKMICSEGKCVVGDDDPAPTTFALTDTCDTLIGTTVEEALSDDTLLIGMLLPTTGGLSESGARVRKAIELAVTEINQSGALFGKRFAVVGCDTATDAEHALIAARWLIDTAKVPAIIGAASSSVTLRVASEVTILAEVLLISPSSTSPAITNLPDNNLVWRTAPSDAIQGAAIGAHLLDENFERVAVVNRDDSYGHGLREAVQASFCEPVRCTSDRYLTRSYPTKDDPEVRASILNELNDFEPEVIVLISYVPDGRLFLNLAGNTGLEHFLLTDSTRNNGLFEVPHDALLRNVLGTAPASPTGNAFRNFGLRYSGKWGEEPGVFTAEGYDAMYLIGFAFATMESPTEATGPKIAAGLGRLLQGDSINAGPSDWNRGVSLLTAGGNIDFVGASGALNFDTNGEAPSDIEGWRFNVDKQVIEPAGILYTADGEYITPAFLQPDEPKK